MPSVRRPMRIEWDEDEAANQPETGLPGCALVLEAREAFQHHATRRIQSHCAVGENHLWA